MKFSAIIPHPKERAENESNRQWWENNPMTYDWNNQLEGMAKGKEYFEAIDNKFGEAQKLLNNPRWPNGYILENFIPYNQVKGKKVLEIGCGAGLVSAHLAQAGADLYAIDLTQKAIELTRARFSLYGLSGNISQMDAEQIDFPDNFFDYIVSWGVIHHSGDMNRIIENIHRCLVPGGKCYLMVYNKNSLRYYVWAGFWRGVVMGKFLKYNLREINGAITDGYYARHLTIKEMRDMAAEFSSIQFSFSEQTGMALRLLLPDPLHYVLNIFTKSGKIKVEKYLAERFGWFMHVVLQK